MGLPTNIDQVKQGASRLLEQFKGKPNIEGTLAAYTSQANDLENNYFNLINNRGLDTAYGYQLDIIGAIVGESRQGRDDDAFRLAIRFKINVNNSNGTPEELTASLKEVTLSSDVDIFEHYPVSYMMKFDGLNIPLNFVEYFQASSIATCNIGLLHDKANGGWIGQDLGDASQAVKATLGDIGDSNALFFVDLYNDGRGESTLTSQFTTADCFNSQIITGTGLTPKDVDVGFDISDNKSISFIKGVSGATCWEECISPLLGINKFRRMGQNTGSIRNFGVTSFLPSGFTLVQDAAIPSVDIINTSLEQIVVNTFRAKEGFCDVVEWTGDGNLSQQIPHIIKEDIAYILAFPKVNSGAAQQDVHWFRGMSSTEYLSGGILTNNVNIWASTLPTNTHITVGYNVGANNLNETGIEYIALIVAHAPTKGSSVIEYISTSTAGVKIQTPFLAGFALVRGASQASTAVADYKSTPARSRTWSGAVAGITPDLFYSFTNDGIYLGSLAATNSSSGTGRYFGVVVKNPEPDINKPDVIPVLNEKIAIDLYSGNAATKQIINNIDLLNGDGILFNWRVDNTNSYIYNYSPEFDSGAIADIGVIGSKGWMNSGGFSASDSITYNNNGFTLGASNSLFNSSGIPYISTSIKKSTGFMDIITWVGDGTSRQEIPHTLGKGVSLLAVTRKTVGSPVNVQMWFKGMPPDKVMTNSSTVTIGSILAGTAPTSTYISVGSIGGSYDMNANGVEYVAYVFADDPTVGITSGSYLASGDDGQLININSRLGFYLARELDSGEGVINTYRTGITSKTFQNTPPTNTLITGIDIDGTKVRLAASNAFTNDTGKTYYWFNIANPTQQ